MDYKPPALTARCPNLPPASRHLGINYSHWWSSRCSRTPASARAHYCPASWRPTPTPAGCHCHPAPDKICHATAPSRRAVRQISDYCPRRERWRLNRRPLPATRQLQNVPRYTKSRRFGHWCSNWPAIVSTRQHFPEYSGSR